MSEALHQLENLRGELDQWHLQGHESAHHLRELKERIVLICRLSPAQIARLPVSDLELFFVLHDHLDDEIDVLREGRPRGMSAGRELRE